MAILSVKACIKDFIVFTIHVIFNAVAYIHIIWIHVHNFQYITLSIIKWYDPPESIHQYCQQYNALVENEHSDNDIE